MENNEIGGTPPLKTLKGTVEYEINFLDESIEFQYSPQSDEINLLALFIAEECALRAKDNIAGFLKANPRHPDHKKMADRLNWAGKTAKGLQIQQQAFIEMMLAEPSDLEKLKESRKTEIAGKIKELESKIQSGEIKLTEQQMPTQE